MVCKEKILLAAFLLPFLLLAGCKNDEGKLKELTNVPPASLVSAKHIDVLFSESGRLQARVTAPIANSITGSYPYLEFPDGFVVNIYDSSKRIETTITGDYGKRVEKTRIMEAKGNVVVLNIRKKEQLNTASLIWDEKKRTIYSNVPVKITTPGKVLFGDGMQSNESFSEYTIIRPHGQMDVKRDSL